VGVGGFGWGKKKKNRGKDQESRCLVKKDRPKRKDARKIKLSTRKPDSFTKALLQKKKKETNLRGREVSWNGDTSIKRAEKSTKFTEVFLKLGGRVSNIC